MGKRQRLGVLVMVLLLLPVLFAPARGTQEPTGEIVINIASGAVGTEYERLLEQADRYMAENPGIKIEALSTPDLATDRLGLYLQFFEAQSPDLDVYMIDVIWPGDLAEHFVDLYEYGAEAQAKEHFPAILENNTVDGKLVGMPWFTDAGLLYYRTDLLDNYGPSPGRTWRPWPAKSRPGKEAPIPTSGVLSGRVMPTRG
jgi:trehalose/maltose transport system substrate-binding protein